ncbi:hypothetical protein KJF94_02525 [Pseudomonas hormoni]|uniref:Uncharacterized protein n=1 Tax=Pseudomonas hormoni TaxID=3093767 RepID=A0ABX8F547_9PSED|nr:hypothetical protein [Pseudomonas hormoni]QVW27039.1 hypothetical protein KJF94_02525 [Pseudomonas hormoni]
MQTAYTVLIMLMLVSVSRLVGRVIPLSLPRVQIAAGALLAWPTFGFTDADCRVYCVATVAARH